MKTKILLFLFSFISVGLLAQTEDFETETVNNKTFTLGSDVFNVSGDLAINSDTDFSCDGSTGSNLFLGTGYLNGLSSGVFGSISIANSSRVFQVSTTTAQCGWPGINDGFNGTTGTIRFIGIKPDNTTVTEDFTLTSVDRTLFVPFTFSPGIWSGVDLKEIQLQIISGMDHWAMDNFVLSAINPLPVELTSFEGNMIADRIVLDWTTASELNNKGFEVEYSDDLENWEQIGFVQGHMTTLEAHDYTFVAPVPKVKHNYYRLKQVDFDGQFEYTEIITVLFDAQLDIGVYPNPTKGKFSITGIDSEETLVEVIDSYGKVIREKMVLNDKIDLTELPKGIYYVRVHAFDEVVTKRLVKNR